MKPVVRPAVQIDFQGVLSLLRERKIISVSAPKDVLQAAETIHKHTYSLILWKFRLKKLPAHAQVFLDEIASDALQLLPQIMMGYRKTAKLLIRGIIENCFRHMYFADHPIEFERVNRDKKWYVKVEELCSYAKNHPKFLECEKKFDAIDRLQSL